MAFGIIKLHATDTDERLNELIRVAVRHDWQGKEASILFVEGYEDDPRELYQIPEVVRFVQRVVSTTGMLAVLEPTTRIPQFAHPNAIMTGGFGAFEVWMLANGYRVGVENVTIGPKEITSFMAELKRAEGRVRLLMNNKFVNIAGQRRLNFGNLR